MVHPTLLILRLELHAASFRPIQKRMQMCVLNRKGQHSYFRIGGTDTDQVESHTEILVVVYELRRQLTIRTKMIIMGIIFPR